MTRRAVLAAAALFAACARRRPEFDYGEPKKRYSLRGLVLRRRPDSRVVIVKHENIVGWMEPMTMEFPVPNLAEFEKIKPGATIRATVCVNDLYYWLTNVTVE